jgi:hypothetical protein
LIDRTAEVSLGSSSTIQMGGWEFPAFWIVVLLVRALIGEGAYSVAAIRDTAVRGTLKTASSQ